MLGSVVDCKKEVRQVKEANNSRTWVVCATRSSCKHAHQIKSMLQLLRCHQQTTAKQQAKAQQSKTDVKNAKT